VLTHPVNQGKGASLRAGFASAIAAGYDDVVTMDADGQHDPRDLAHFLTAAQDHPEAAMIIGARLERHRMPLARRWTNRLMSWWLSRLSGVEVPDTQCGFRLIRANFLRQCRLVSQHFEIESELVLEAARLKQPILSIPIRTLYHHEASHIHPVRDTVRFLRLLASYRGNHP